MVPSALLCKFILKMGWLSVVGPDQKQYTARLHYRPIEVDAQCAPSDTLHTSRCGMMSVHSCFMECMSNEACAYFWHSKPDGFGTCGLCSKTHSGTGVYRENVDLYKVYDEAALVGGIKHGHRPPLIRENVVLNRYFVSDSYSHC